MKKLILLLFLICSQLFGQNMSKEEFQKDRFNLGMSFLTKGENERAIKLFNHAQHIIPDNKLGQIAFKKCDSLKPIIRKKLKQDIIGNWKKIHKGSNWGIPDENGIIGEMITINENEILFFELYKNAKEWCLVKTEPIVFCKKAEEGSEIYDVTFTEITFKNKEVWQFYIEEKSGLLKTFLFGHESDDTLSQIICGGISEEYFKLE